MSQYRQSQRVTVIFIPDALASANEYIKAERTNRYMAAQIKKQETYRVKLACIGVLPIEKYPVKISFIWHCANKKIDPDNTAFAKKFVLDGLQEAGVLKKDSWDYVSGGFQDTFEVGSPVGVHVHIESL